jgi:hypothetical protein
VSAVLFTPEAGYPSTWFNLLALTAAMAVMAANMAAYHHLRHGQTARLDPRCFLTTWTLVSAAFAPLFVFAGGYSFRLLGLLVLTLVQVIIAHVFAGPIHRFLDRLFFGREVQLLRSNLAAAAQNGALTRDADLGALLTHAQAGLAELSREHLVRLTEQALRRLSDPAALAACGLIVHLPRTLAAARPSAAANQPPAPTPLEQATALREILARAIERLKPPDRLPALGAPEALQYHILREEYLLGRPNKQIMTRHSISEGTFHRNRRRAIAILAHELAQEEQRQPVGQH